MELVTKRDMDDSRKFMEIYWPGVVNEDESPIHDLAQAIADGRRLPSSAETTGK